MTFGSVFNTVFSSVCGSAFVIAIVYWQEKIPQCLRTLAGLPMKTEEVVEGRESRGPSHASPPGGGEGTESVGSPEVEVEGRLPGVDLRPYQVPVDTAPGVEVRCLTKVVVGWCLTRVGDEDVLPGLVGEGGGHCVIAVGVCWGGV